MEIVCTNVEVTCLERLEQWQFTGGLVDVFCLVFRFLLLSPQTNVKGSTFVLPALEPHVEAFCVVKISPFFFNLLISGFGMEKTVNL